MKKFLSNITLIFFVFSVCGCKKGGQISVFCTNIEQFESEMGIINIGQKSLGNVLLIDTISKRAFLLASIDATASETKSSTIRDSLVMLSSTKFKIQLSGDIANASPQVKGEIKSEIDNETTFFLSNCVRKNIEHIPQRLNYVNSKDPQNYEAPLKNNVNTIIAVVTSMTYADRFEFRLRKQSDASASLNTITVGNYNLKVNYSCQNGLNIHAKQDGIFYKVNYYTLHLNNFVLLAKRINLNEYEMGENSLE